MVTVGRAVMPLQEPEVAFPVFDRDAVADRVVPDKTIAIEAMTLATFRMRLIFSGSP